MNRSLSQYPKAFYTAAYVVIIGLGIAFLYLAKPILVPLAFSALFALMLYPFVRIFERNGFPRILAITVTLIAVILALVGITYLLSSQIYNFISDLDSLSGRFNKLKIDLEWWLYNNFNIQFDQRGNIVQESMNKFMDSGVVLMEGTIATFMVLLNFFGLVPIYIFLFLLYRSSFKEFFLVISPTEKHRTVRSVIRQIEKVVQNYIVGLVIVMVIVGTLNTITLLVIGVQYAMFFGFLAALLTVIPYIGIFIGSLLPAMYALATLNSPWYAFAVVATFLFVQFLEGNFITPRITGNKVKVNPLAAIVALIVGGYLWGTAGLIIFIPLVAMLKVVFDHIPSMQPYGFLLGTEIYGKEKALFAASQQWGGDV
ncbi:MAG: AI-2E family transporter, partial [Bacteroidota bacterium]|nr:AI-2E family transporter [Bacteroidota bacterium]